MEEKNENTYTVGKRIGTWKNGLAQTITFVVTEDCNLRCKYCYITHKASNKRMNFDTAKKFIDYLLDDNIKRSDAVIIEFIGGEPLIEVELISKICDYFKIVTYEKMDKWYWNYRINISSNGVNYADDDVQSFIKKNQGKLNIGLSIDGTKEKHDMHRVFLDNTGSYDTVMKNARLYLQQFVGTTKMTFASQDLSLLKESVISIYQNGIKLIAANVVFENVWKENDDLIFENQLKELADYIIDNKLFNSLYCTLFFDGIGQPNTKELLKKTACGAGKMIAVDADGKIFPCIRYKAYSLNNKEEWILGTVENGIDMEKVRPFVVTTSELQSDKECINCEIATGCSFCQGFNYDVAETNTNFTRAKYICKMHKARVRANDYYFSLLYNRYNIKRENYDYNKSKRMYILLSDDYVTFCEYKNINASRKIIPRESLDKILRFCRQNFFIPIFIHSNSAVDYYDKDEFEDYTVFHIMPAHFYEESKELKDVKLVFDKDNYDMYIQDTLENCILNVDSSDIDNLAIYAIELFKRTKHIDVNILDLSSELSEQIYKEQLLIIKDYLVKLLRDTGEKKTINLITDLLDLESNNNCKAGEKDFTVASNEKIYLCPAVYSEEASNYIGDIDQGINNHKNNHLFTMEYRPICNVCDAKQCVNCVYVNYRYTKEVNVSPSFQCRKSYIERNVTRQYQIDIGIDEDKIVSEILYEDPIEIYFEKNGGAPGYYSCKRK